MIEGTTFAGDRDITPMQNAKDKRVTSHFIETAQSFLSNEFYGSSLGSDYPEIPEEFVPGISHQDFMGIAKRLQRSAGI